MSTAQHNPIMLPASGDLSTSTFCGVVQDSNGRAALPSAGAAILGVLTNEPKAIDEASRIETIGSGKVKLRYGGSISTIPQALKVTSAGKFIAASASDVANGQCVAIALKTGADGEVGEGVIVGSAVTMTALGGDQLITLGTTVPDSAFSVMYVSTDGTKTGALPNGKWDGQELTIIQAAATNTPVGTITGTFKTLAGVAAGTLALGTAVAVIARFVWDGAAWRPITAITGTGSSLT